jgi:hypothetical protein
MKLKTFFVLPLSFFLFFSSSVAQDYLSIGLDASQLIGELNEFYGNPVGANVQYEKEISESFTGLVQSGFTYVPNDLIIDALIFMIPARVGAKYFFTDKFYAQGVIGAHYVNAVTTFGTGSGTFFSFGLSGGVQLGPIDIGPILNLVDNSWSHVGLRLAYRMER